MKWVDGMDVLIRLFIFSLDCKTYGEVFSSMER